MRTETLRRACALGFALGCLALLALGKPDQIGEASRHMPGWGKAMLCVALMGLTSAVVMLAWAAMTARMLRWTRERIARIERAQS